MADAMILLTPSAVGKLAELRAHAPDDALLRLYVTGRSCCGYRHGLLFVERPEPDESVIVVSGVRISVDMSGPPYEEGATIDFVETTEGAGFAVRTPMSSAGCTCHAR